MDFKSAIHWSEEHPWGAGAIIFIGGLFLLWLLGYFSKAPQQQQSDNGLAAAYYQAEAVQAATGNQLMIAQSNNVAKTAQTQIMADMATRINAQNTSAAVQISQTNATASTDIAAIHADAQKYDTAAQVSMNAVNQTDAVITALAPTEMLLNNGAAVLNIPGQPQFSAGAGNVSVPNPNTLKSMGWTDNQIAQEMVNAGYGPP